MSKKTLKAIKANIFEVGHIRIAVEVKDCPCTAKGEDSPLKLEIYGDQNENKAFVLTHHCYDTQPKLRPIKDSDEVKCPYFDGSFEGQIYCKLIES